jgi:hypothetical protein
MTYNDFWLTAGFLCLGLCGYTFIVTGMVAEEYSAPIVYQIGERIGLFWLLEAALCVTTPMWRFVATVHLYLLHELLFIKR